MVAYLVNFLSYNYKIYLTYFYYTLNIEYIFKIFSYYPISLLKHLNNIKNITIVIKLYFSIICFI